MTMPLTYSLTENDAENHLVDFLGLKPPWPHVWGKLGDVSSVTPSSGEVVAQQTKGGL